MKGCPDTVTCVSKGSQPSGPPATYLKEGESHRLVPRYIGISDVSKEAEGTLLRKSCSDTLPSPVRILNLY